MSEGRRSQVILLDERRLDIVIQTRLYAGELLDIVASHFSLKEKEYFGIAFIDDCGQFSWLHLDKRVLEHNFPKKSSQSSQLTFYFRIKYFVESITQLNDSSTIEAFYLQTKSLISKGELESDNDIVFQLAALVIQATYGDYTDDESFKCHLKRLPVLPTSTLKEFSSIAICEQHVLDHYKELAGQTRGAAIVNYLSIVESLPTYGQHYYEIKDKAGNGVWLGLSYRGISQYDKNDRRTPRQVFLWKQLENLYFRDKKFTIEVHEARRVVHTLSSFNLYEDAIEEPVEEFDELSNAICDPTTQVSVSRRALAPSSVTVYVWYASSPNIAKCIWSMAIAQHQFFLDRYQKKNVCHVVRSLSQIASELCRSVQSLSSASSHSNISRSNSSHSLPTIIVEGELSEESKAATVEMLSALQSRKDALQDVLKKKTDELKALCLKEGELTGELPPETPFQPGEAQPQVRRRIGTSFSISDKIIGRNKGKDKEKLNDLELDYEIQSKIASAAYKLATDVTARKSVRKIRKVSYQQATSKLKDIEEKLSTLKREKESQKKQNTDGNFCNNAVVFLRLPSSSSENSMKDRIRLKSMSNAPSVIPAISLPHLNDTVCSSAPPSPAKNRHRHQSLQHMPVAMTTDNVYEDVTPQYDTRRNSSSYSAASAEYDAISCGSSSVASLGLPYRNRFEANLDIEGTNHYSVPNRRASQAFNDPDDLFLDDKSQDAISRCSVDVSRPSRYSNTPLSCSYDERIAYSQSIDFPSRIPDEYDKVSIVSNGMVNCDDLAYQLRYPSDSMKKEMCNHVENAPSRTQTVLHHKLSQVHISEPDLNLEDRVEGAHAIRHVFSVPTLKSRPASSSLHAISSLSDHSMNRTQYEPDRNQSMNQVADLVQASVLLQDCKRATSSTLLDFSTKTKTKEWVETSLDSPVVAKKRKPKVSESFSKSELTQPTRWLENGLPSKFSNDFYRNQSKAKQLKDSRKFVRSTSDLRQSPSPLIAPSNQTQSSMADYVNINSSACQVRERPQSSLSMYRDRHTYHYYENIAELNSDAIKAPTPEPSCYYENVPNQDVKTGFDASEKFVKHSSLKKTPTFTTRAIAQPQEPPKLQIRHNSDCYIPEKHVVEISNDDDDDYEPIEYCEPAKHSTHCDISQYPPPHTFHSESVTPEQDVLKCKSWPHFPLSPPTQDGAPLSPTAMSFSPNLEVNVVSVGHFQPYWEETKPYEISDFYKYSTKHRRQHNAADISTNQGWQNAERHNPADISTNQGWQNAEKHNPADISTNQGWQNVEKHNPADISTNHAWPNMEKEISTKPSKQQSYLAVHASLEGIRPNESRQNISAERQKELAGDRATMFGNVESLNSSAQDYENCPVLSPDVPLHHPGDKDKSLSFGEMDLRISLADTFHEEMVAWYQNQDSVKKATLV